MTLNEIIRLVGRNAVHRLERDMFTVTTAPHPLAVFSEYRLFISPQHGVLRIDGRASIDTSPQSLRRGFADLLDKLTATYGPPEQKNLQIMPMAAFWDMATSDAPRHLVLTLGTANAERSPNITPLLLAYECERIESFAGAKTPQATVSAPADSTAPISQVATPEIIVGEAARTRQVRYFVYGSGRASLTYRNESGGTEQVTVSLPWNLTFTGAVKQFVYLSAQKTGRDGSIECTIYLDDVPVKRASSNSPFGIASVSGTIPPMQ
jgi:hypothetical protein